jgi:RHS repeat-associated protein
LKECSVTGSPHCKLSYGKTCIEAGYPRKKKVLEKILFEGGNYTKLAYRNSKVESIYVPFKDEKSQEIYNIDYHTHYTTVKDLYKGKTIYRFCDKYRLEKKERYHEGNFYSRQQFHWGGHHKSGMPGKPLKDIEGYLLYKGMANSKKELLSITTYTYDSSGNVLKETIAGDLTGNNPGKPIKIKDKKPVLNDHETYSRYYTYTANGFNLVTSIKDDDGSLITLQYVPNSDKVTKKLTYADGIIVSREISEYNHLSLLTKKIVDDGNSEDSASMCGVTQRVITTIFPNMQSGSPGFGKPSSVIESYWDEENRCEKRLTRVDSFYGSYDLLTTEAHYDAEDDLRYILTYNYDSSGNCIEQTDPLGNITKYRFNEIKRCIFKELVGSGFYTNYSYDVHGNLIKTQEYHSSGEIFTNEAEYDFLNRKVKEIDTFGNVTSYEYDDMGRLIKVIHPQCITAGGNFESSVDSKSYNYLDQLTSETDPSGNSINKKYTVRGQVTEVDFPDGTREICRYNLNGSLHKKILKNNSYSILKYDSRKRLVREDTYSANGSFLRASECHYRGNNLIFEIDFMGNITEYRYDGAGRKIGLIKHGCNQSHKEEYVYDGLGRIYILRKWFGDAEDQFTQNIKDFDLLNRLIEERIEDAAGKVYSRKQFSYDIAGNCVQNIVDLDDQSSAIYETKYSTFNLPKLTINPMGFSTHFSYDFNFTDEKGKKVLKSIITDPLGNQSTTVFDSRGRESYIEQRNSHHQLLSCERFFYNNSGLKVKHIAEVIIDGKKNREYCICWNYDKLNRPISVIEDPSGKNKRTLMTYTQLGCLETKTKPDGIILKHSFDELGRESGITSSDGSVAYKYEYDTNDHLIQSQDLVKGKVLYKQFDAFGNIISEYLSDGFSTSMKYDGFRRLTELTLQDGSKIAYKYDPLSAVSVERISKQGNFLYSHNYETRNLEGRTLRSSLITGDTVDFTWDSLGRLLSMDSMHSREEIPIDGYDAIGNLLKVNFQQPTANFVEEYKYDDLNQLLFENNIKIHNYQNDSLRNRLCKDEHQYHLNSINQITSDGLLNYSYDFNGNLLSQNNNEEVQYKFDALNRLISASKDREWKVNYAYDSSGRCIQRDKFSWNGEWIANNCNKFIYQGVHEIGSFDNEGEILELRVLGQREESLFRLAVAVELKGKIFAPIYDHRFNVINMIDFETNLSEEFYRYSAYGEILCYDSEGRQLANSRLQNPWLYASKRYDQQTDLYNFGKRFYRPNLGRWISPDPGDFIDGPNLYAYAHNRPMICTDFYGFEATPAYPVYGGMAHGISMEAFASLGRVIELAAHHGIPHHRTQYVGEGIGRMLQNKSFSHEYSGDIKAVSGKVGSGDTGNQRFRFFPGIMTDEASARAVAEQLSGLLDGGEVYYTCNITRGLASDVFDAACEHMGYICPSLKGEYKVLMDDYNEMRGKYGDNFSLELIPHSRGALEVALMTASLQKEVKQKMYINSMGGAKLIYQGDFSDAKNYVNDSDIVVPIGIIGTVMGCGFNPTKEKREALFKKPNLVHTGYKSNSWTSFIDDHLLDSSGYQRSMKEIVDAAKQRKKI